MHTTPSSSSPSTENGKDAVSSRFLKRRLAYSLAAGATAAVGATDADGAVVYSEIQNIVISQGYAQDIELNGDDPNYAYSDLVLQNYLFTNGPYQGFMVRYAPGRVVGFNAGAGNLAYVTALSEGALVDDTTVSGTLFLGSMAYGATNPNAQFNDAPDAYVGFGFPIEGTLHYGWLRVAINNAAGTFVIRDWAYNDEAGVGLLTGETGVSVDGDYNGNGTVDAADYTVWRDSFGSTTELDADGDDSGEIDAGDYAVWANNFGPAVSNSRAVPEPATLGLLALGAAGLGLLRRSRRSLPTPHSLPTNQLSAK